MANLMRELDEILQMQQKAALGLVVPPTPFCNILAAGTEKPVYCACANSLLTSSTEDICNATATKFKCTDSVCVAGPSGPFDNYPDCLAGCSSEPTPASGPTPAPSPGKYTCLVSSYTCQESPFGPFLKKSDCTAECHK